MSPSGERERPRGLKTFLGLAYGSTLAGLFLSSVSASRSQGEFVLAGLIVGLAAGTWATFPAAAPDDWRRVFWRGPGPSTGGRLPELDALRGLAVVAVIGYHLWQTHPLFFAGWGAVDLFFVLSGFLITEILLRHSGEPRFLLKFYARRSLRIWPAYYLALFVLVAINARLPVPAPLRGLPYYATFTQNVPAYWSGAVPSFSQAFGHTWSLAVEEQFYLLWPVLVLAAGRRGVAPLSTIFVVVAVVERSRRLDPQALLARCDGLALGGLLAVLLEDRDAIRAASGKYRVRFLVIAALAVAFLAWEYWRGNPLMYPPKSREWTMLAVNLAGFGVVGLTVCSSGQGWLALLRDRRLVFLGTISYGLYLYHIPVIKAVDASAHRLGLGDGAARDACKLALTLAVASASWFWVERPMLALKRRFEYRGIQVPRSAPAGPSFSSVTDPGANPRNVLSPAQPLPEEFGLAIPEAPP